MFQALDYLSAIEVPTQADRSMEMCVRAQMWIMASLGHPKLGPSQERLVELMEGYPDGFEVPHPDDRKSLHAIAKAVGSAFLMYSGLFASELRSVSTLSSNYCQSLSVAVGENTSQRVILSPDALCRPDLDASKARRYTKGVLAATQLRMDLVRSYATDDPRRVAMMHTSSITCGTTPLVCRHFYDDPGYNLDEILLHDELRWMIRASDMASSYRIF